MRQRWHDLLFMHFEADAAALRTAIPAPLELDTYQGAAWVAVVPFRMTGVALRGCPAIPGTHAFPELNVRTYVKYRGKPGVWFFSLDAANALAVAVARAWFHLPYYRAEMRCDAQGAAVLYHHRRVHHGAPPAEFEGSYAPRGDAAAARPGSLEEFLVERYCLYARGVGGRLVRGEILHAPWPLQAADADVHTNSAAAAAGITIKVRKPLLHFARALDVAVWSPEPAGD